MPSTVPKWNVQSHTWLQEVFEFVDGYIHDDKALIIIHPWKGKTRNDTLGYASSYSFLKKKDWWGMNRLHLASPVSPSSTIFLCQFTLIPIMFDFNKFNALRLIS